MPARIDEVTARKIQETAKIIYQTLACQNFARVDMFLTPNNEIVLMRLIRFLVLLIIAVFPR